jgi:hypothetical protein
MLLQLEELLIALGIILAVFLIAILINTLILKVAIKAVRGEKTQFGSVLLTSLLLIVISAVVTYAVNLVLPGYFYVGILVPLIFQVFLIKARHRTTFLGALGALIIYVIVMVVLIFVLIFVFPAIYATIITFIGL